MPPRRRAVLVLAVLALAWTAIAAYTGGFRIDVGGLRVSARGTRNPLILAFAAGAMAWLLAPRGARSRTLAADLTSFVAVIPLRARTARAAAFVAGLASLLIVVVGVSEGARGAGGSDSYGYVSQAVMFASGRLHVDEPMMDLFPSYDRRAFAPLGWSPDAGRNAILPTYSPGLPLLMSIFARAGGPAAVFYVVPLLGAMTVWSTFLIGRALGGSLAGAAGAVLMASSPTFLFHLTGGPMSDIPATAWWALCLALVAGGGWRTALAGGLAAGAAILTRPNLVPVVLAPALVLAWPLIRGAARTQEARGAILRLLAFSPGVIAASLTVAAFNWHWYGSPLTSGYGALDALYGYEYLWPNIRNFTLWLAETQTPLIALAVCAPFIAGRLDSSGPARALMAGAIAIVLAVLASYAFYYPFEPWWNLRFILPSFPVLLSWLAVTLVAIGRRRVDPHGAFAAVLVIALSAHGVSTARARAAFETSADQRYAYVGRYVRDHLPPSAVVLTVLHSGSIRLYSGRPTIRWDWLTGTQLDPLIADLVAAGFDPYLLLEPFEVAPFEKTFAGSPRTTLPPPLAWAPANDVRLYALARESAGGPPAIIPTDGPVPVPLAGVPTAP